MEKRNKRKLPPLNKEVLNGLVSGKYSNDVAADMSGRCPQYMPCLKRKYKEVGTSIFTHGNTGRKPATTKTKAEIDNLINAWDKTNIYGIKIFDGVTNFFHFHSIMIRDNILNMSYNTMKKYLKIAGKKSTKTRKIKSEKPLHESRLPMPSFGMLIQGDGTPFDWAGFGEKWCLHTLVDDATKKVVGAYFSLYECSFGYYECMRQMLLNYGIPESLYTDRLTVFFKNRKQNEQNKKPLKDYDNEEKTQFAQALEKLGIGLIAALSPQAKGRVERFNGVVQDRLAAEIRLANVKTIEEANEFLIQKFIKMYNDEFGIEPRNKKSSFVPLTNEQKKSLPELLAIKLDRKTDYGCVLSLDNYLFKVSGHPKETIKIFMSYEVGIYGKTKNGKRVELKLFDDDEDGSKMPKVWKDLIGKYYFEDAKAKTNAPRNQIVTPNFPINTGQTKAG